jgi:hypothetical protein
MTKRPVTIYGCSTDQKNDCDYKYLARVWFYRTVAIFIGTIFVTSCLGVWYTVEWKTVNDRDIVFLKKETENNSKRISRMELVQSDVDTIKTWLRPKGDK